MTCSALRFVDFPTSQLRLDGISDEFRAPVFPHERVYPLADAIRQSNQRRFHSQRGPSHASGGSRYRNLAQDGFRYRLLTLVSDIAYITVTGYGDNKVRNREPRLVGDVIELPLTKGYVTIIDRVDERLAAFRWTASESCNGVVYAARMSYSGGKGKFLRLHREVLGEACSGLVVDHIDGNGLNNRRSNLRAVESVTNHRNVSGPRSDSTTGVLGVSWNKRDNIWTAQIGIAGRKVHLGSFSTAEEASAARLSAEAKYWGVQPRRSWAHSAGGKDSRRG